MYYSDYLAPECELILLSAETSLLVTTSSGEQFKNPSNPGEDWLDDWE